MIKDFASKPEFSDWWSRVRTSITKIFTVLTCAQTEDPVSSIPKKPNPRNIRNEEKLKELEEEIKRYVNK